MNLNLTAKEKLIKARVQLLQDNPFFGSLAMGLTFIETDSLSTAGIDKRGIMVYNPKFVDKLTLDETKTLVVHEIMHVANLHFTRIGSRNIVAWNQSGDIVINNLEVNNGFRFSGGLLVGIIPHDNTYKDGDLIVEEIDKKCVEEVYNIVIKNFKDEDNGGGSGKGEGDGESKDGNQNPNGFDEHKYDNEDSSNPTTQEENRKIEEMWKQNIADAVQRAKQQGNLPKGMERMIENIESPQVSWKRVLYKMVQNSIPQGYTYNEPHKRTHSLGIYLPKRKRGQKLDLVVAIDTSGSIGKDELTKFFSELYSIANSFSSVNIHVLGWDTQCESHNIIDNYNKQKLLSEINLQGGGGTDFTGIYDYLKSKNIKSKLLVFFTDGYADFSEREEIKTLWVISSGGRTDMPFGTTILLN